MNHLPPVPDHFVQQALSIANAWQNNLDNLITGAGSIQSKPPAVDNDGKKYSGRNIPRIFIGKQWEEWVNNNISDCYINTGVAQSLLVPQDGVEDTQATSLHNDTERKFCLFYLVKKDNDDQWTRWYCLKDGPLIPAKKQVYALQKNTIDQIVSTTGEEFQLIDEIVMPLYTWVYADVRILHQATNHQGQRIAIHVSFNEDVFGLFDRTDKTNKEVV
jgi:hypothetical protein